MEDLFCQLTGAEEGSRLIVLMLYIYWGALILIGVGLVWVFIRQSFCRNEGIFRDNRRDRTHDESVDN